MATSWCQYEIHWHLLASLNIALRGAQTRVPLNSEQNQLLLSFQKGPFSRGAAAPWVPFHGKCTGAFLRAGEMQTSLFLWKLREGEGETERQSTWCCGHRGLSALGNKLKASSFCVPWPTKLASHTSSVPGAC